MSAVSILYVEDNEDLREAVALLLEDDQREIISCASGEDALVQARERRFDVLITDVSLPGISGTQLAQQLLAERPDQRVVMCSGYGANRSVAELGPNVRWITKPFEMDDMEHLLNGLMRTGNAA